MKAGVYQIRNLISDRRYIGSAAGINGFSGRWRVHLHKLLNCKHHSPKLQNAWNKYGETNFAFEILETCKASQCIEREQHYLDTLLFASCNDARFDELGYNICRIAGSQLGNKRSLESRQKMSISHTGSRHRNYGKQLPKITRSRISKANLGHEVSVETRKQIAISVGRLNENQVKQIKAQLQSGIKQNIIASAFDISQSLVSQIKHGKKWGWV